MLLLDLGQLIKKINRTYFKSTTALWIIDYRGTEEKSKPKRKI